MAVAFLATFWCSMRNSYRSRFHVAKFGAMQHEKQPSRTWSCSSLMEAAKLVIQSSDLPQGAALQQQQALLGQAMKDMGTEELLKMLEAETFETHSHFKIF